MCVHSQKVISAQCSECQREEIHWRENGGRNYDSLVIPVCLNNRGTGLRRTARSVLVAMKSKSARETCSVGD